MNKEDFKKIGLTQIADDIQQVEDEREAKKAERLARKRAKEARIRSEKRQKLVAPILLLITILLGSIAMLLQARF